MLTPLKWLGKQRLGKRTTLGIFASVFLLLTMSLQTAWAAVNTVTSLTSQPTSLVTSTASNQKFVFTLANIWNEATSDTLTLTFPAGFNLGAVSQTDIDVLSGAANLTVAGNCAGTDEVGAAKAGQVITLTMCTGDGGTQAAGATVTILIGTNAASQAAGVNQITNPASVGTYYIDLSGSAANNVGSIPVPIVTSSSSGASGTVSGTVVTTTTGGGGSSCCTSPSPSLSTTTTTSPVPNVSYPEVTESPAASTSPAASASPSPAASTSTGGATESPAASPSESPAATTSPDFTLGVSASDIPLSTSTGSIDVAVDSQPVVTVDLNGTVDTSQVASVYVTVDGSTYVLDSNGDGTYSGSINAPVAEETLKATVTLDSGATITKNLGVVPATGEVYEVDPATQAKTPVGGSLVTVYAIDAAGNATVWDAAAYGQQNPKVVGAQGSFAWYVPNGTYEVRATKDGYTQGTTRVNVSNNVLTSGVEMARIVTPVVPGTAQAALRVGASVAEAVAVTATLANVLALVAFGLLTFLQHLWSWFFFIIFARKGKFGIVYNAISKEPLDLATVRLYRLSDHALVRTVVTNKKGEYFFTVDKDDSYRVEVVKAGFVFPSVYLGGVADDGAFTEVYYGTPIVIDEQKERRIALNLPMDPLETGKFHEPWRIRLMRALRFALWMLAPIGLVFALFGLIIAPSWYTGAILFVQIVILALNIRLASPRVLHSAGVVRDAQTGAPLGQATVRLFEPTYNKLIETTVTDAFGRYVFFLGPNVYYVTVEKTGYTSGKIEGIDFSKNVGVREFGQPIGLQRMSAPASIKTP